MQIAILELEFLNKDVNDNRARMQSISSKELKRLMFFFCFFIRSIAL